MSTLPNYLRLDELLARDTSPRWFEGIAIVQAVCRQLLEQESSPSGFPAAGDILLGASGSVMIAGVSGGNPVQAAAHLLALMLSEDVPVRLRLAVTQATGTETAYRSLAEFSEALAYFERPNGSVLIAGLRDRAAAAAPRPVPVLPSVKTPPPPSPANGPQTVPIAPPHRGVSRTAVIAAAGAAVVCAAVWLAPTRGEAERAATPSANAVEQATASRPPTKVREKPGPLRSPVPASLKNAESHGQRVRVPELPPPNLPPAVAPPEFQVSARTLYYRLPSADGTDSVVIAPEPDEPEQPLEPADTGVMKPKNNPSPGLIYSKADAQVTPPVSVYPKLTTEAMDGTVRGGTLLELTIAKDGLVERVRLLTTPRNIHEFMLLSAAKAWRFEPATLSGTAVRFRQTIALARLP
jgi:hypothetical protein